MNLTNSHIYLMFDIQNKFGQIVGQVQISIHIEKDLEKWKTPDLVKQEAVDYFKTQNIQYNDETLCAFYTGDLIPT